MKKQVISGADLIEVLKEAREEQGKSKRKLSKEVGININGIWQMEKGEKEPKLDKAFKIAELLGIKIFIEK